MLKEKDKATSHSPTSEWIMPAASTIKPKERYFVVDSGASMHMVRPWGYRRIRRRWWRPTTRCKQEKKRRLFVTVMLLEETSGVFSLEKLCEDHGYTYHWTSGQKPHLTKHGTRINCNFANYVPVVVPGLSTSSSTSSSPDSSTSSSQDSVVGTENPATERSEIMSEESWGNPSRGSAETENTNDEDDEELRSELLQDLPELLQDYKENLLDKNVQPHQYSPALLMNYQWSREQKWYQVEVSTESTLTSRKTEIVTSAWGQK